jgi:hypothetical protein
MGEGERLLKFGLLPNLRVTRVTTGEREINFIQEQRKEDASFYVVWPEPLAKDTNSSASSIWATKLLRMRRR